LDKVKTRYFSIKTKMASNKVYQKKAMLIGPAGIGKTRAVAELLHKLNPNAPQASKGEHDDLLEKLGMVTPPVEEWIYRPTMGVELHPIVFKTGNKTVQINLYDLAGNPNLAGNDMTGYSMGASFVIIFAPDGEEGPYIEQSHPFRCKIITERDQLEEAILSMIG
jgi:GTPase SAR1 family protein